MAIKKSNSRRKTTRVVSRIIEHHNDIRDMYSLVFGQPDEFLREAVKLRDSLKEQCEAARGLMAHVDALRKIETITALAVAFSDSNHTAQHDKYSSCFVCGIVKMLKQIAEVAGKAHPAAPSSFSIQIDPCTKVAKINLDGGSLP